MPPKYLYCFIHIPKTGGSTINRQLRNHLSNDEFAHFRRRGKRPRANVDLFPELPRWKRKRTRAMSGHYLRADAHELVPNSIPRYLTVMRDPADRVLSVYNFRRHKGEADRLPFAQWLEQYKTDVAYHLIRTGHNIPRDDSTDDAVRTALESMWFVGVTEHLDEDLPHLFRHIGVPTEWSNQRVAVKDESKLAEAKSMPRGERWKVDNPVERRAELTPELRAEIHLRNPGDLMLYRWAVELRKKKLPDLRSE